MIAIAHKKYLEGKQKIDKIKKVCKKGCGSKRLLQSTKKIKSPATGLTPRQSTSYGLALSLHDCLRPSAECKYKARLTLLKRSTIPMLSDARARLHHVASDKNFLDFATHTCLLVSCRVHLEHEQCGTLMTPRVLDRRPRVKPPFLVARKVKFEKVPAKLREFDER
jgi:hypothetical protein